MRLPRLRFVRPLAVTLALLSCTENGPTGPALNPTARLNLSGSSGSVVISQAYGGGGNSGATIKNDFIELFNNGSSAVDLTGWSVQYASSAGSFSSATPLSGTLAAGRYLLIQEAAGSGGTVSLSPDISGTIAMSGTDGKVALLRSTPLLPCGATAAPCSTSQLAQIVDMVGYGSANLFEGGAAAQVLTNSTSSLRNGSGCTDTDRNSIDFTRVTPTGATVHNSATAAHVCPTVSNPVDHVTVSPTTATLSYKGTQQLTAAVFSPASADITSTFPASWSSSDPSLATVSKTGLVTAVGIGDVVITAASTYKTTQATLHLSPPPPPPAVHFSELHYDNTGTDADEKIEIQGPAGTDLTGWHIVLYGGDAVPAFSAYNDTPLEIDIPASCGTSGVVVVDYPVNGIKNAKSSGVGNPAGMALVDNTGAVVEFLSYEGTFTALDGSAAGMTSTDIGVSEDNPVPAAGNSLHRDSYGIWSAPSAQDFGVCNGTGGTPTSSNRITFSGRLSSDPALPVGFEDQLFATEKNVSGATISTAFTWTSDTPSIATVDAQGVFHGVSTGNAVLRATAADGTTATTTLAVVVNTFSTTADWSGNLEFGIPSGHAQAGDLRITHDQFTASFNKTRNIPNWVSAKLDASHYSTGSDRCDCFTYDALVADSGGARYTTDVYTGEGSVWNRGHLLRSADVEASAGDNSIAYLFTNIAPQSAQMNQGPWAQEENFLGDLAKTGGKDVYEIIGVSGVSATEPRLVKANVTIPAYFWKVAVIVPHGTKLADIHSYTDLQVIAVIMPNIAAVNGDWTTYKTTVHAVEDLSGYDLLNNLPDDIELLVENNDRPPTASLTGPQTGIEGGSVDLDASGSSDPDGDALTYTWDFGDGSTGTGAHVSHVYADNGQYLVTLTVADPVGAKASTTAVESVSNANPSVVVDAAGSITSGDNFTLAGGFGDQGQNDAPWGYVIDWGDGTTSSASSSVQGAIFGSHPYFTAGSYTITLTVTDKDGGSSSASTTLQVNPVVATVELTQSQINIANNGNGEIRITVPGSAAFSASDIVISSVRIGHTFASTNGNGTAKVRIADTDHDGIADLIALFGRGELAANGDLSGDTIILSANLTDGRQIQAVLPVSVKEN
jgi:DNA/RNA endonuclease G (NUC1)/PKD repeat protein